MTLKAYRVIIFILFLYISNYCLGQSTIEFRDTIKITGRFIVDVKNEKVYLCKGNKTVKGGISIWYITKFRRYGNFMGNDEVKARYRRITNKKLDICNSIKTQDYIVDEDKLINNRWFISQFKNEEFIQILYNGEKFLALKCW